MGKTDDTTNPPRGGDSGRFVRMQIVNCSCNPNFVGGGFICEGKFVFLFFKAAVR